MLGALFGSKMKKDIIAQPGHSRVLPGEMVSSPGAVAPPAPVKRQLTRQSSKMGPAGRAQRQITRKLTLQKMEIEKQQEKKIASKQCGDLVKHMRGLEGCVSRPHARRSSPWRLLGHVARAHARIHGMHTHTRAVHARTKLHVRTSRRDSGHSCV